MNSNRPALLMALLSLGCASGCTTPPRADPPVQVVDACPRPPSLPEELTRPLEANFLQRTESSLTNYFSLELKPTRSLGSGTSR